MKKMMKIIDYIKCYIAKEKKVSMKMKLLLLISLLMIPTVVFASDTDSSFPLLYAIGMEAFCSIHMSLFVLKPLSQIISKDNSSKIFWKLFGIRVALLLFFDIFITPYIAILDFLFIFFAGFIISVLHKKSDNSSANNQSSIQPFKDVSGIELRCAKCNTVLNITDKVCSNCGEPFDGNNVIVSESTDAINNPPKVAVLSSNFDYMYNMPEDKMLDEFINRELKKAGIDKDTKLVPSDILKRKKILNLIFSFLVFIYITLIFFHFPIYTYIIGLILLFIIFKLTRKYDLMKFLKKQLTERPSEKISNIIMNIKNTFVTDNTKGMFIGSLVVAVILPLIIFSTPKIIYEKIDDGYAVRYYIFGLTNFKTVNIPEIHNNEKVTSLRGNTFSNMPFLESVVLPDSITEIRGQAFKNCRNLVNVNIPSGLEYLGGGAFYNASSIKNIELPNTLTYLGGEAFYGAKSLENIKLSENLNEIKGDSFEYCTSLKKIIIPDSVERIGGHAFYGDSSLYEVIFTENSNLKEIGSSAFRQCSSLYSITIPSNTYVNARAFKESPTHINYFGYQYNYNYDYDYNY